MCVKKTLWLKKKQGAELSRTDPLPDPVIQEQTWNFSGAKLDWSNNYCAVF